MSGTTFLPMGQEVLFPIAEPSQFEHALEHLFNEFPEPIVVEGHFIFRRELDCMSLRLIFNYPSQRIDSRIQRALNFIHTSYDNDISLEQIAHSAYLSVYHFCRLFRREMGMSCSQYLNRFRISKAKQFLSETDLLISEVCFETGFNSLTHFGRVFKQVEGQTPSEYRKATNPKKAEFVVKKATDVEHFSLPEDIIYGR